MLKGFIDLVCCYHGRYFLLDYKSNYLGDHLHDYAPDKLAAAITKSRYDLQYSLYSLALHRYLRSRLPEYDYEQHFGGVAYWFLRGVNDKGQGIHLDRLPQADIEALDQLFHHSTHNTNGMHA